MIEIIKELNIEVSKPNVFQAVVAKQYDMNTRFIKATFVDDGKKITINQSATVQVVINALRPDGASKGFDGVINDDGTVTVPLHSWMLEQVGTVTCDISVIDLDTDDNKKLTTTSFTLLVEKAAWDGDGVTTDPQYDLLIELINTCNSASEVAEEALQKSNEANAKYDACVIATEAANEAADKANDAASGVVTIEQNGKGPLKFWVGTQEQYDEIAVKEENCLYLISDDKALETLEGQMNELQSNVEAQIETLQSTMGEQIRTLQSTTGEQIETLQSTVALHGENISELQGHDYIIEQGDSVVGDDTWMYRKWNSGLIELWCEARRASASLVVTGTDSREAKVSYPFVVRTPVVQAQVTSYGWNIARPIYCAVGTTEVTISIYPRGEIAENGAYGFSICVVGKWK